MAQPWAIDRLLWSDLWTVTPYIQQYQMVSVDRGGHHLRRLTIRIDGARIGRSPALGARSPAAARALPQDFGTAPTLRFRPRKGVALEK
jgi:hypothetical protein